MHKKFVLLGTGTFGTTMAVILARNRERANDNCRIVMYVRRAELYTNLQLHRVNTEFVALRDVCIPAQVEFTMDIKTAMDGVTHLVLAIPSRHIEAVLNKVAPYLASGTKVLSLVKGFYIDRTTGSFSRITELISRKLQIDENDLCTLNGPNIYTELALSLVGKGSGVCRALLASPSQANAEEWREFYHLPHVLAITAGTDMISAEICGAVKNVVAIAVGFADEFGRSGNGRGISSNYRASLITQALEEITLFSQALGGKSCTCYGPAGLGDLLATCDAGRSHQAGALLAQGFSVDEVCEKFKPQEIEGFHTLRLIAEFLRVNQMESPMIQELNHIIFGNYHSHNDLNRLIEFGLKPDAASIQHSC